MFGFRENMAQSSKSVESQTESRSENLRDTKWSFYYADALVVAHLNSTIWPLSTTESYKLSLNPADFAAIIHRNVVRNAIFFGKGPSRQIAEQRMQTLIRLSNGLDYELFVESENVVALTSEATPASAEQPNETGEQQSDIHVLNII